MTEGTNEGHILCSTHGPTKPIEQASLYIIDSLYILHALYIFSAQELQCISTNAIVQVIVHHLYMFGSGLLGELMVAYRGSLYSIIKHER
jgi:uncharacterized membrane protein